MLNQPWTKIEPDLSNAPPFTKGGVGEFEAKILGMASLNHPPVSPLRKGGQIRTLFRDNRLWPMKRRSTLLRDGPATGHGGTSSTLSETRSGPTGSGRSPLIP